jgi:hypothetical protein
MNHDMGQAEDATQHEDAYSDSGTSPPRFPAELIARLYHANHLVPVPLDPFEKKPRWRGGSLAFSTRSGAMGPCTSPSASPWWHRARRT